MEKNKVNPKRYNVCGAVVVVRKEHLEEILRYLKGLAGCEIVEHDDIGRVAITVEDQETETAYDLMDRIKLYPIVESITLVSHYFE